MRASITVALLFLPFACYAQNVVQVTPSTSYYWSFSSSSSVEGAASTAMTMLGVSTTASQVPGKGALWLFTGSGSPYNSYASAYRPLIPAAPLSSIAVLDYTMLVSSSSFFQTSEDKAYAPYINLLLDTNGGGKANAQLCYEPRFNGSWTVNSWSSWDTTQGYWWYSKVGQSATKTITASMTAYPELRTATVVGIEISVGGGTTFAPWNNKVGAVESLEFGLSGKATYTFDFAG
ncbi:MAG TPA: hypothetical protein VGL56_15445 [Fimbriimonadaceae bacterium]|jgi:hypothetical protein